MRGCLIVTRVGWWPSLILLDLRAARCAYPSDRREWAPLSDEENLRRLVASPTRAELGELVSAIFELQLDTLEALDKISDSNNRADIQKAVESAKRLLALLRKLTGEDKEPQNG
jgi:hypothetical protein